MKDAIVATYDVKVTSFGELPSVENRGDTTSVWRFAGKPAAACTLGVNDHFHPRVTLVCGGDELHRKLAAP